MLTSGSPKSRIAANEIVFCHSHKSFEQVLHLSHHDNLFINTVESFQPHNNRDFYSSNYSRTVNIYIVLQKRTFCQTLIKSILLKLLRPVLGRKFVLAVHLRFFWVHLSCTQYKVFGLVPMSPTHTGLVNLRTLEPNISSLGPFKPPTNDVQVLQM